MNTKSRVLQLFATLALLGPLSLAYAGEYYGISDKSTPTTHYYATRGSDGEVMFSDRGGGEKHEIRIANELGHWHPEVSWVSPDHYDKWVYRSGNMIKMWEGGKLTKIRVGLD